jgi:hypothetical protein
VEAFKFAASSISFGLIGLSETWVQRFKKRISGSSYDETGEHCKSNASRRAHDRRALTGEAGNASRRKIIVEGTACSPEWASAWRTQDESGPTFSRVIRTNFGDRMAKIFRENSDSLVNLHRKMKAFQNASLHRSTMIIKE